MNAAGLDWAGTAAALDAADRDAGLGPDDLETLATACYLLGRTGDALDALRRAWRGHLDAGAPLRAARCGFWLVFHLGNLGELAQAAGWAARVERVLAAEPADTPERGYLVSRAAWERFQGGDAEGAAAGAAEAATIARAAGDDDLLGLALSLQGYALIRRQRVGPALAVLDEAMVAVVGGELSPVAAGVVYCMMIAACREVFEVGRARQWTAALSTWCERQPGLVTFSGTCLVHRAQILQLGGDWPEAVSAAELACDRLATLDRGPGAGLAFYQLGEVHRVRGETLAAEAAYREASRLGHEPQPGLALLRLAQGRGAGARTALARVLAETADPFRRAALLPAQVEVLLAAGELGEAGAAAGELAGAAAGVGTPAILAAADQARGAVLLAGGDAAGALVPLRAAWRAWHELDAPHEAARVRVLLARACQALGDEDAAALELDAARATFSQLGAAPDLAALDGPAGGNGGLTARELEVLGLLAKGLTNQAIAVELVLSERTVHRHVSNIFTKLGVATRTAAAAWAYEHLR